MTTNALLEPYAGRRRTTSCCADRDVCSTAILTFPVSCLPFPHSPSSSQPHASPQLNVWTATTVFLLRLVQSWRRRCCQVSTAFLSVLVDALDTDDDPRAQPRCRLLCGWCKWPASHVQRSLLHPSTHGRAVPARISLPPPWWSVCLATLDHWRCGLLGLLASQEGNQRSQDVSSRRCRSSRCGGDCAVVASPVCAMGAAAATAAAWQQRLCSFSTSPNASQRRHARAGRRRGCPAGSIVTSSCGAPAATPVSRAAVRSHSVAMDVGSSPPASAPSAAAVAAAANATGPGAGWMDLATTAIAHGPRWPASGRFAKPRAASSSTCSLTS